ncbi:MAG: cyclodeaminase/cyclohydrolase family protein [Clostridiales bacterium]|jgi:formiminotetrahydrofolate cyclodeaminase|nr:cyclodeaminase/cyclohydrolase family protein [Clostridiales bacterium]MDR2711556.1 cyclodeaminase/cyclohydrolase family protein [Clostridiales bacterium]
MEIIDRSCRVFFEELAGPSPTPGGGGAAALGSALGAALSQMVISLTTGKKKYAQYEEELAALGQEAQTLREELLAQVAADAEAFAPLAAAYSLPANSDEEKAAKTARLSERGHQAALVPLQIMEKTYRALELACRTSEIGSKIMISDAGCSLLFLEAGLKAASYNVQINLPLITDPATVSQLQERMDWLLLEGEKLAKMGLAIVKERMG